jgi:hypothetical protein
MFGNISSPKMVLHSFLHTINSLIANLLFESKQKMGNIYMNGDLTFS